MQETLANAFGVSGESLDFAGTILEAAENAADDNIADYLKDILAYRTGSFLEELDEYSVEVQAKSLFIKQHSLHGNGAVRHRHGNLSGCR